MTISKMTEEEIHNYIEKHLPIRSSEKDKFGEVFTPAHLIEELFDALPREVWTDPNLTWLDPAAGVGNFALLAYVRLMDGLKKEIPDETKRKSHILSRMLYQVEINPENSAKIRKLFSIPGSKTIFTGSFLETETESNVNPKMMSHFGISEFDMIMGNPPYQRSLEAHEKHGTNAGRQTLWDKFILASFSVLKPNGHIAFITPNSWRGLGKLAHLWGFMKSKEIPYLHIYGMKDGIKEFGASTRFDLFVIKNKENKSGKYKTHVIDELGGEHHIELAKWPFFPNYAYKDIHSILTNPSKGIDVLYDTTYHTQHANQMKSAKSGKHKHPVVHSITKEGLGFWYADENKGHFGTPKVLLNFNQFQYPHNDYRGEYGMSQLTFAIPVKSKKEGDALVKAINSPRFKEIVKATKWGVFQTDWRMFKYFKPDFYKMKAFAKHSGVAKPSSGVKTRKRNSMASSKKKTRRLRKE